MRKLVSGAVLTASIVLGPMAFAASWVNITQCILAWHQAMLDATSLQGQALYQYIREHTDKLDNCVRNELGLNGTAPTNTFSIVHAAGASVPEAVIFHFDNSFPQGEQVYLTVYNDGPTGGIASGSVTLNGVQVVSPAELNGADSLEKPVTLVSGQNELRLDVGVNDTGALYVLVDTDRFIPPN